MAFIDELKKYVEMGVSASKDALSKAGDAVTKFGDESVIRIEKRQMENQLRQEILNVGYDILKAFEEDKKETVSVSDDFIQARITKIKELKEEISKREQSLKKEEKGNL